MPKRVIDSDRLERSEKIAKCTRMVKLPIGVLYPWLIARADRNGNFEIPVGFNPCPEAWKTHSLLIRSGNSKKFREIWSIALSDFHRTGLLFMYQKNGKKYAHVMGSEARGLLPKPSEYARFPTDIPPPPASLMRRYAARFSYSCTKNGNRESIAIKSPLGIGIGETSGQHSPYLRRKREKRAQNLAALQSELRQEELRREAHVGEGPEVSGPEACPPEVREQIRRLARKTTMPESPLPQEMEDEEAAAIRVRQITALEESRSEVAQK